LWLALLAFSTAATVVAIALRLAMRPRPSVLRRHAERLLVVPCVNASLASVTVALPWLLLAAEVTPAALAAHLAWLAALATALAFMAGRSELLAAAEVVWAIAAIAAARAWLLEQRPGWSWPDARILQVHGIALASVAAAFGAARLGLRANRAARRLLDPVWPAVDQVLHHALAAAQWFFVLVCLAPHLAGELGVRSVGAPPSLFGLTLDVGPAAWLLLGLLGAGSLLRLWYGLEDVDRGSMLLLAATAPGLVAGRFAFEPAVEPAWRWALVAVFLGASAIVWSRAPLAQLARRWGVRARLGDGAVLSARALLVATTAAPVVVLTAVAAVLAVSGHEPPGPAPGSFFAQMGPQWSYLVPLVTLVVVLVGYALRERSAAHAFAAGAVVELAVALDYLLNVGTLDTVELARLVQLLTIVSAVWAGAWLLARRWTDAWSEAKPGSSRLLMGVQLAEGMLGNAALLVPAILTLGLVAPHAHMPQPHTGLPAWIDAAGGPLGWAALVLAVAAIACRWVQAARAVNPHFVALAGMSTLGLAACTVFGLWPEWGFRALMLGWAIYAALVPMTTWWIASLRTSPDAAGPPRALVQVAAVWVRLAGLAAVAMGLWASPEYDQQLWAATAIAIASLAGSVMAVWQRREGWALAAALGVNLAASLAVWHHHFNTYLAQWWLDLLRANIIASASVGLVWLLAVRRLDQLREPSVRTSPLLTLQVAMPVVGQAILCLLPIIHLVWRPERLPEWIAAMGAPVTWLALALTVAAAGWQAVRISRKHIAGVASAALVGAAALATCHTGALADFGSYYFLTTAMAAIALAVVAGGMIAEVPLCRLSLRESGVAFAERKATLATWATAVGAMVIVLSTIHCGEDPHRPWWFASTLLSASLTAGLLAVWLRWTAYVCVSGLILNVAGTVIWYVLRGPDQVLSLIETNVLCLAAGSVIWSAIGFVLPRPRQSEPRPSGSGQSVTSAAPPRSRFGSDGLTAGSYTRPAAALALVVSVGLVVVRLVVDVVAFPPDHASTLSWVSLGATAAALAKLLAARRMGWSRPGLYLLGLAAVGLGLDARWLAGYELPWIATLDLALFALAAAVAGWALGKWLPDWQWPLDPSCSGDARLVLPNLAPRDWFSPAQQVVVAVAAILSGWVAIDWAFDGCTYTELRFFTGRVVGPAAAALLLAAALVMVRQSRDAARRDWQLATLLLATMVLATAGWWRLAADGPSLWIHRAVIAMVAASLGAIGSGLLAARSARKGDRHLLCEAPSGPFQQEVPVPFSRSTFARGDWLTAARRSTATLGSLSILMLVCVLALEAYFHEPEGTPMALSAVIAVGVTLVGLAAGLVALAVAPGADPAGLSLRGRTIYVYGAELILAVLGVHLWLTEPQLFRLEIFERYWIYVVMGVAFVGAGLAEFFQRQRLGVLAEPLERTALALPLASCAGFWFLPDASPAFWFLAALFYGVMAVGRRNGWMALAAVLTGNMGLWVLWHRVELHFLDRPQLWLIPAALCALVAEFLHHDRLKEGQSAALRYMALSVIYVSSTVEFLRGVGESVWLPLVLVGLSVAGALVGLLLRIRSFLYLGVTFLMVVIVRMILYAAFEQGQIWVFWAAVVALGLAVIGLFAVFEKRRNDVLAALERFKGWGQ